MSREENSELRVNTNACMKYFYKGVKCIQLTAVSNTQNIKTQQSCNLKNKVTEAEKTGTTVKNSFCNNLETVLEKRRINYFRDRKQTASRHHNIHF